MLYYVDERSGWTPVRPAAEGALDFWGLDSLCGFRIIHDALGRRGAIVLA